MTASPQYADWILRDQLVRRHVKICHACALKFAEEAALLEETRTKMERILPKDAMIHQMSNILEEASRLA